MLICHAETREAAIEKTIRAIQEYEITGLETTLGFCRFVLEHNAFRSGNFDTRFVENYFTPTTLQPTPDEAEERIAAAIASTLMDETQKAPTHKTPSSKAPSKWKTQR